MTIDQLPEDTTATGSEWLVVQDAGASKKMAVSRITAVSQTALDAHVNDVDSAHAASAVSAAPGAAITGTNVQQQLSQLETMATNGDARITTNATNLTNHISNPTGAHAATAVSAAATVLGGITVQAQLNDAGNKIVANTASIATNTNNLTAHVGSSTAHAATNITSAPVSGGTATTVQGVLEELAARITILEAAP